MPNKVSPIANISSYVQQYKKPKRADTPIVTLYTPCDSVDQDHVDRCKLLGNFVDIKV